MNNPSSTAPPADAAMRSVFERATGLPWPTREGDAVILTGVRLRALIEHVAAAERLRCAHAPDQA